MRNDFVIRSSRDGAHPRADRFEVQQRLADIGGVETAVCSTMLIMCAVRAADGRWHHRSPDVAAPHGDQPSVSRMWIASRSAGG
jgi:hypothetical protein